MGLEPQALKELFSHWAEQEKVRVCEFFSGNDLLLAEFAMSSIECGFFWLPEHFVKLRLSQSLFSEYIYI